jgi:hypothetical protein
MSRTLDEERYAKELLAQRQRVKARSYLEKSGCGPGQYEAVLNDKGELNALKEKKNIQSTKTDNTLELLRKDSAARNASSNGGEAQAKAALIEQQRALRESREKAASEGELPVGWQQVTDPQTSRTYYWNISTNETTWTRPIAPMAQPKGRTLPNGWVELLHPATNQKYYKHTSGKTSNVEPTAENNVSLEPVSARNYAAVAQDQYDLPLHLTFALICCFKNIE